MMYPVLQPVLRPVLRGPFERPLGSLLAAVKAMFANGEPGYIYSTDMSTLYQDSAGTLPVTGIEQRVGLRLDISGNGNHARQTTTTKQAYYSRRVNLFTKTENFEDATWGKTNVTPDATKYIAPNGTLTASKLVVGADGAATISRDIAASGAVSGNVYSISAKKGSSATSANIFILRNVTTSQNLAVLTINYDTGVISQTTGSGAYSYAEDNGFWKINIPVTSGVSNGDTLRVYVCYSGTPQTAGTFAYVWGASLTLAIDSHLPYQWVNTATDYDADPAKFPPFLSEDGGDDSYTVSASGGGTAGFFFSEAIVVRGGAGTNRVLFSDAGTNTGYIVRINTANKLELAAGNGTAYTTVATTETLTVGSSAVVQAWDDGTNLNVRINKGAVASVARPTVSAGTAACSLGQDNGAATGYFNGRDYSIVYRKDSGLTQAQRDTVYAYQAQEGRFA